MDALQPIEHLYEPCPTTGCYLWLGALHQGYGRITVNRRVHRAHRYAWLLAGNTLPAYPEYVIDHVCNVKSCVNPDHLQVATQRQNILRGTAPAAVNAEKTHCGGGHALTGDNVRWEGSSRGCRECDRMRYHSDAERKAKVNARVAARREAFLKAGLTSRGTPRKNRGYTPISLT